MSDWHYGVITTLLVFPLWATYVSGNKVKLFQRGIIEPFILAFLGSVGLLIGAAVSKNWGVFDTILALVSGLAILVIIIKSKHGTLGADKESDDE